MAQPYTSLQAYQDKGYSDLSTEKALLRNKHKK